MPARQSFEWNTREAKKEQPCYSVDPETGERTLINASSMDQSTQLTHLRKKLKASGLHTDAEIKDIIKRIKR